MLSQDFFNDELLKERVDAFYGYGNYQGHYWFIGMEERGEDFQDIEKRIKEHQPKAVVFYGMGYEYFWRRITEKITDLEFLPTSEGFLICQNSQTVFVIAKHPVARGLKNEYFHNIGRSIAANIAEK